MAAGRAVRRGLSRGMLEALDGLLLPPPGQVLEVLEQGVFSVDLADLVNEPGGSRPQLQHVAALQLLVDLLVESPQPNADRDELLVVQNLEQDPAVFRVIAYQAAQVVASFMQVVDALRGSGQLRIRLLLDDQVDQRTLLGQLAVVIDHTDCGQGRKKSGSCLNPEADAFAKKKRCLDRGRRHSAIPTFAVLLAHGDFLVGGVMRLLGRP